jgi:hypothetical protein
MNNDEFEKKYGKPIAFSDKALEEMAEDSLFTTRNLAREMLRLRSLLARFEWCGYRGWGPASCPSCDAFQPDSKYGDREYKAGDDLGGVQFGHYEDCELAAVLKNAGALP